MTMYKRSCIYAFICAVISFILSGCTLIRKVNDEDSAKISLPTSTTTIYQTTTSGALRPYNEDNSIEQNTRAPIKNLTTGTYKPLQQTATVPETIISDETGQVTAPSADQFIGIMVTYYGGEKTEGDVLSRSDFKVEAEYKNGFLVTVSGWEVSFLGPLKPGYNSVLISYKDSICDVTVYAKPIS